MYIKIPIIGIYTMVFKQYCWAYKRENVHHRYIVSLFISCGCVMSIVRLAGKIYDNCQTCDAHTNSAGAIMKPPTTIRNILQIQ